MATSAMRSATVAPGRGRNDARTRQARAPKPQIEAGRLDLVGGERPSRRRWRRRRSGPRWSGRAGCRGAGSCVATVADGAAAGKPTQRIAQNGRPRLSCARFLRLKPAHDRRPERLGGRHPPGPRRPGALAVWRDGRGPLSDAELRLRHRRERRRALRRREPGFIYSRYGNPDGARCSRTGWRCSKAPRPAAPPRRAWPRFIWRSSACLRAGDHVVAGQGPVRLLPLDPQQLAARASAWRPPSSRGRHRGLARGGRGPTPRSVFIETPANPLLEIIDIAAVAAIAREIGAKVWSTTCSPRRSSRSR